MNINRILFFVLASCMISCISEVELDIPTSKEKLVVDAWFTDTQSEGGSLHKLFLSKTTPVMSNNKAKQVSDALVILKDNEGGEFEMTYVVSENENIKSSYQINKNLTIGRSYSIYIKTKDGEEYLSPAQNITDYRYGPYIFIEEDIDQDDQAYDKLLVEPKFPKEGVYYFILKLRYKYEYRTKEEIESDAGAEYSFLKDYLLGSNIYTDIEDSQSYFEDISAGYTYQVQQHIISKGVYKFLKLIKQQADNEMENMFSTPPAPLRGNIHRLNSTNINEDALGYFIISSVQYSNELTYRGN